MIVFAHTKFGSVRMQGNGVKRGGGEESAPPVSASFSNSGPDRVKTPFYHSIHLFEGHRSE